MIGPGLRAARQHDLHGASRRRRARCGQRGAVTAVTVVLVGVIAMTGLLVATLGGAVVDQRRVAAAADLAALAGAAALQHGQDGCAAARSAARSNGARLQDCRVAGRTVLVAVERPPSPALRRVLGRDVRVSSRARAGPVSGPG